MTKGQTSKMEARKKKNKAAAAQRRRRPLPAGWIQGDFLPSTVTEGDLLELVEHSMLVHKSWRLPADDEVEPAPREGERVLLLSHDHRGFQKKSQSSYPALQLSESVRNWQSTWFYCQDIACPNASTGLPPFSLDRPAPPKQLALSKAEKNDIQPLVEALVDVVRKGSPHRPAEVLGRRIQLVPRDHAYVALQAPEDSTQTNVMGVPEERVTSWVLQIMGPCENPQRTSPSDAFQRGSPSTESGVDQLVLTRLERESRGGGGRRQLREGVECRVCLQQRESEEEGSEEEEEDEEMTRHLRA
ncbi:hypothetical protein ZWY2020_039578 [Hordeum vulgare]|nr:hypothetical protein ZWY2020_039578 [Hordeum vulgare]